MMIPERLMLTEDTVCKKNFTEDFLDNDSKIG